MRWFVYEHLCASVGAATVPASLLREGRAMLAALTTDLAHHPGAQVTTLLHPEQEPLDPAIACVHTAEPLAAIATLATAADRSIVIAPESDGVLAEICRRVEESGGRLYGLSAAMVEIFADKLATSQRFATWFLPSTTYPELPDSPWLVLKPRDGAGCQWTYRVRNEYLHRFVEWIGDHDGPREWIVQPYHDGLAASIAVLAGPRGRVIFPAGEQLVEETPVDFFPPRAAFQFLYLGGRIPLDETQAKIARDYVLPFLDTLGAWTGYLGIDLLLDRGLDRGNHRLCEVNPRLTTAYVGYRAGLRPWIAAAWHADNPAGILEPHLPDFPALAFDPSGRVTGGLPQNDPSESLDKRFPHDDAAETENASTETTR